MRSVLCFLWVLGWTSVALGDGAPHGAPSTAKPGVEVKLHDTAVFRVWRDHPPLSAADRARAARTALEQALKNRRIEVRMGNEGVAHVIYAGDVPVIQLFPEDAEAAGDASLEVHSERVASRVKEVLVVERQRGEIADTVLAVCLVVLFALVALYVLRRIGEWSEQAREHILAHPESIGAIRVQSLEVIGAAPLRGVLLASLLVGRWLLVIGILYAWLVAAFGQFEATRPYTEQLTSFVMTPLSVLAGRLLSALPLGVLAVVSAALVYVILRFVEQFFLSVSQGESRLSSVPSDLIAPTSLLVRGAIVLLVLVFAGPVITGDPQSGLARVGAGVLAAVALAATPLLASMVVGTVLVFTRRVRVGEDVDIGQQRGRVIALNLLDVLLRARDGTDVRIPYLLTLVRPISRYTTSVLRTVQISVAVGTSLESSRDVLLRCASQHGDAAQVELSHVDAQGALFTVSVRSVEPSIESRLRLALAQALIGAGVGLGRSSVTERGTDP